MGMETAPHRSTEELADAVRTLSAADWARLRKIAAYYTRSQAMEPEDLMQETLRRALDGGRNCPSNVEVVKFISEAMRSVASGEHEKRRGRPALVVIDGQGGEDGAVDPPDPSANAEEQITRDQEAATMINALLAMFGDDSIARTIVEGMLDGVEGEVLRGRTRLDPTAYQSKRRMIRRRIERRFPSGWKL